MKTPEGVAGAATAGAASILWTGPGILLASLMIAWGAECTQFFVAQGLALAILALLQTLPEFAVEAVFGYHQQSQYLLANLTGALRLLTGLGWPMIYASAAIAYRAKHKQPLRRIRLEGPHSIQVISLAACLVYVAVVAWKGSLTVIDTGILMAIYCGYLWFLQHGPPEDHEGIEDLGAVPRAIVLAKPAMRNAGIATLFLCGGAMIYFLAEPFVNSMFAVATALGISSFVFVQWVAPFVSEFPEFFSAFYWARSIDRAPMALMNLVSSNINQWTLLAAMLPVVLSIGHGSVIALHFDAMQSSEYLMTLAQSCLGLMFLLDMEILWWEAAGLFALWLVQFLFSVGDASGSVHNAITGAYFVWAVIEGVRLALRGRMPEAWTEFWRVVRAV